MNGLISFATAHPKIKPMAAMLFGSLSIIILLISFHLNFQQHTASAILSGAF